MPRRFFPLARVAPAAVALLAAGAGAAAAQSPSAPADTAAAAARRGFADSWFWGVKGGAARFGTVTDGNKVAGLAGFDWMITRSKAALLVGAEQSFFSHTSAVAEPGSPGFARVVDLKNARRFSAAVLAVPGMLGAVRPYAGLGVGLDVLREVTPRGEFASTAQRAAVDDRVDDGSSKASLLFVAGGQVQFGRAAVFVQANGTPAQARTLWNRGGVAQLEAGFRYNLAPSREY
jgi:hypothetical protein